MCKFPHTDQAKYETYKVTYKTLKDMINVNDKGNDNNIHYSIMFLSLFIISTII